MITDAILGFVFDILTAVLSIFKSQPDVVLSPALANAISNVQGIMSTVSPFFPLDTLFVIIGIYVGIEVAIFLYKTIMWVIKKIPTIN